MTHALKEELVRLLEVRTMSNFERRKRRLQSIPLDVLPEALRRARDGLPLTTEQYIASHLGFLPGEMEEELQRKAKSATGSAVLT
jgi:hypothetical protein